MTGAIHLSLARSIMVDLRQRGELCYILAPVKPESGPWATLETQARIEERIAEIILAGLVPVAVEMAEIKERAEALEERISEMTRQNETKGTR